MTQLTAIVPQLRLFQRVRVREGVYQFGGMAGVVMRSRKHSDELVTYDVELDDKAYMHECGADAVAFDECELQQADPEEVKRD